MIRSTIMGLLVTGVMGINPAFASSGHHEGADAHRGTINDGMTYKVEPVQFARAMDGEAGHGMDREMGKGHMNGKMAEQMKGHMNGMFLIKKDIDGYQVSFHVMKVPKGMQKHGGTYHVMIKVERGGKPLTDLIVNSRVIHPDGQPESKMMMRMGDWYMVGYNLEHKGKYQIMVLFKTSDEKKHFGGIEYQTQTPVK